MSKRRMQIEQPTFPLTSTAFAAALRTGHGRALQHLKAHGSAGLVEKIVEACTSSLSYDPQCEAPRAPWLASIVECANLRNEVTQALGYLLREPPSEDHRDLEQRSAVLKEFAAAGSEEAKRLLYRSLARLPDTADVIAADHIVSLDGVAGLLHVARQLGRWVQDDPDFWVDDYLIAQCDESTGRAQGLAALEREAIHDSCVASYLASMHGTLELRNAQAGQFDATVHTAAQIVALVNTDLKNPCHWFRAWGARVDADQRETVFLALLDTTEPERVKRLLRCFGKTGVPRFDSRLLQWLASPDKMLRWATVTALAPIRHTALREIALQMIADGDTANGIRLLLGNFEDGDLRACVARLQWHDDVDERHHLASKVLELCIAHPGPDALDGLLYVYEYSPCSTCRRRAVNALTDMDVAPEWLLAESVLDCDPDTRALASAFANRARA